MRVYLDTCVVIYRVEEPLQFLPLVQAAIARYPSGVFCISPKTPDALHLATAKHHACDVFLTNDDRLGRVAGAMRMDTLG